jgi:hypothetical protein
MQSWMRGETVATKRLQIKKDWSTGVRPAISMPMVDTLSQAKYVPRARFPALLSIC